MQKKKNKIKLRIPKRYCSKKKRKEIVLIKIVVVVI